MGVARVAEAARLMLPSLPVLLMTGYAKTPLPLDAEVLAKLFTLDALKARVRSTTADSVGR